MGGLQRLDNCNTGLPLKGYRRIEKDSEFDETIAQRKALDGGGSYLIIRLNNACFMSIGHITL